MFHFYSPHPMSHIFKDWLPVDMEFIIPMSPCGFHKLVESHVPKRPCFPPVSINWCSRYGLCFIPILCINNMNAILPLLGLVYTYDNIDNDQSDACMI